MSRYCIVPTCKVTENNSPHKTFIRVPSDPMKRNKWLDALGIERSVYSAKSGLCVCENHFNLEKDMENYFQYRMMGVRKRMKPGVVPHLLLTAAKKQKIASTPNYKENKRGFKYRIDGNMPRKKSALSQISKDAIRKRKYLASETPEARYSRLATNRERMARKRSSIYLNSAQVRFDTFEKLPWSHNHKKGFNHNIEPNKSIHEMSSTSEEHEPYYWCIVPMCKNTSLRNEGKVFIDVPKEINRRKEWFNAMRRDFNQSESKTMALTVCEDHFDQDKFCQKTWHNMKRTLLSQSDGKCDESIDLENDMENYMKWKMMSRTKLFMKKDVVPHKFECQPDWQEQTSDFDSQNGGNIKQEDLEEPNFEIRIKTEISEDVDYNNPQTDNQHEINNQYFEDVIVKKENLEEIFIKEEINEDQSEDNIGNIEEVLINVGNAEDIFEREDLNEQLTVREDLFAENRDKNEEQKQMENESLVDDVFVKQELTEELIIKDETSPPDVSKNDTLVKKPKAKPFICEVCQQPFARSDHLKLHSRTHTGERPYKCQICTQTFTTTSSLRRHERALDHKTNTPYICQICGEGFEEHYELVTHKMLHPKDKKFVCEVCDQAFSEPNYLKLHFVTHNDDRPFTCDICGSTFARLNTFKRHKLAHSGFKPCKITFTNSESTGQKEANIGQKKFSCELCSKTFVHNKSLITHKLTHKPGEKQFLCDICQRGFQKLYKLKLHKLTHTGVKPHVCDICQRGFARSDKLYTHKLTHTGEKRFFCDVCQKGFTRSDKLKLHKLTHSDEKPFACHVCEKAFRHQNSLNLHKLTHTGRKPFECNLCQKTFSYLRSLKTHKCKAKST